MGTFANTVIYQSVHLSVIKQKLFCSLSNYICMLCWYSFLLCTHRYSICVNTARAGIDKKMDKLFHKPHSC